jgi:hypothetical protein
MPVVSTDPPILRLLFEKRHFRPEGLIFNPQLQACIQAFFSNLFEQKVVFGRRPVATMDQDAFRTRSMKCDIQSVLSILDGGSDSERASALLRRSMTLRFNVFRFGGRESII